MQRVELRHHMDAKAYRWLVSKARRDHWRVAAWRDLDDLIQDGHFHYARVRAKYPHITDPPHIMRLFQRTFLNHLNDLSRDRSKELRALEEYAVEQGQVDFAEPGILEKIPAPLRALVERLRSDDHAVELLRAPYDPDEKGRRETLNERLCSIAGFDPGEVDLHSMVCAVVE